MGCFYPLLPVAKDAIKPVLKNILTPTIEFWAAMNPGKIKEKR